MKANHKIAMAAVLLLLVSASAFLNRQQLVPASKQKPETVEDRADLFSAAQYEGIVHYHGALRDTHDIDYRVLTLHQGGDIAWQAHRHFDGTGVGSLSGSGRGLLLVIDTAQDLVRLEVSTSLEGVYTDAFVAYVQQRQMVPFFQSGRVADGILATTELIVTRAQDAEAGKAFSPPTQSRSMGGGATAAAGIDGGEQDGGERERNTFKQQTGNIDSAGLAPEQVAALYLQAMANRDARHTLPIYSSASVRMLKDWTVTPAQMDNIARSYAKCRVERVITEGDRAVVRYPPEQRQCAPHFLRREQQEWKLDLTVMSSLIRFNHQNAWRFTDPGQNPYAFAFSDWRFDNNGFPRVD